MIARGQEVLELFAEQLQLLGVRRRQMSGTPSTFGTARNKLKLTVQDENLSHKLHELLSHLVVENVGSISAKCNWVFTVGHPSVIPYQLSLFFCIHRLCPANTRPDFRTQIA
jgi:hypothetical protein